MEIKRAKTAVDWMAKSLPIGTKAWGDLVDRYQRFVINEQLMNETHWRRLEEQFVPGWDDDGGWKGEFWGKLMRGACLVCSSTGDKALYEMLKNSVIRLLSYQDDLGRICSYTTDREFNGWDMWSRKYVMLGCQYFIEICDDEALCETIIEALKKHADYIIGKVGPGEGQIDITATTSQWGGANSCSIMEPMVRLYELTGEQRYLEFAEYIIRRGGSSILNIFESAYEMRYPYTWGENATKAYETMSCFEGLLRYYRVTGNEKWKTAVLNFAEMVRESDITLIGNAGCTHELFDHAAIRQFEPDAKGIMQETCVAVTWMKLCYQLLCLTGDIKWANCIETTMYNALIGAANTDFSNRNGGLAFDSYSPLFMDTRGQGIGGLRILNYFWINGCCASIAAAGIGLMGEFPVMQMEKGILINTFVDGTATATIHGKPVNITMKTQYPRSGSVSVSVETEAQDDFAVYVRVPAFSKETTLVLNDQPVDCVAGQYAVIQRNWCGRNKIQLELDCDIRTITPKDFGATRVDRVALAVGPLVLARDVRFGEDITVPVALSDAAIQVVPVENPAFPAEVCLKVIQEDGTTFTVADYASCGKTWDARSLMSAWLPVV